MKQQLLCLTLLLASLGFAQQQGQPGMQQPPHGTPPTFPEGQQVPGEPPNRPLPPDEAAPAPRAMSTPEVQQQISKHLSSEPALAQSNLKARVSNNSVVLTGNATEKQHDLAVRIAQSYAGERKIVDKIKLRQQT